MPESITADDVTGTDLLAAKEAGADSLFRVIASIDPEAAEVPKNHTARKLARATADCDSQLERIEAIEEMAERSGDFITSLFRGDLAEALYHSDATNRRLLIRTLDTELLLSELVKDRGSEDAARRWLEPEIERYGWSSVE